MLLFFANVFLYVTLQQLMRERQQMASRPFASVAVSLEARGELTEMLLPVVDVSLPDTQRYLFSLEWLDWPAQLSLAKADISSFF